MIGDAFSREAQKLNRDTLRIPRTNSMIVCIYSNHSSVIWSHTMYRIWKWQLNMPSNCYYKSFPRWVILFTQNKDFWCIVPSYTTSFHMPDQTRESNLQLQWTRNLCKTHWTHNGKLSTKFDTQTNQVHKAR